MKFGKIAFAVPLLCLAQISTADDLRNELLRCAALKDDSDRLACYDQMGGQETTVADALVSPTVANTDDAVPAAEIGERGRAEEKQQMEQHKVVNAHVIRCTKDARKKYLFYLAGGEVWKQVSDKRLSYQKCDFNVTISKDFFGYKMQVNGEKSRTRISRVR